MKEPQVTFFRTVTPSVAFLGRKFILAWYKATSRFPYLAIPICSQELLSGVDFPMLIVLKITLPNLPPNARTPQIFK
jgi:hypothetical protein